MKKEDKIYCINNLSSAVISNLLTRFPKQDCIELFMSFYSSNTYKKLCDIETGLWAEGPIYIADLYLKEMIKKNE